MRVDIQTLAIISTFTTLCTECVKNIAKNLGRKCEPNIISMVIAVLLSFVIEIVKPVFVDGIPFDANIAYNFAVMAFFGMLAANLGFDKLKELILAFMPEK